jgi:hypothetical protein
VARCPWCVAALRFDSFFSSICSSGHRAIGSSAHRPIGASTNSDLYPLQSALQLSAFSSHPVAQTCFARFAAFPCRAGARPGLGRPEGWPYTRRTMSARKTRNHDIAMRTCFPRSAACVTGRPQEPRTCKAGPRLLGANRVLPTPLGSYAPFECQQGLGIPTSYGLIGRAPENCF